MVTNNSDFLKWDVKPTWTVSYPSEIEGGTGGQTIQVFGINRAVGDISRDWEVVHSVGQFRQGYVAKPSDIRFTIAVKEMSYSFEAMRRIAIGGIIFDVICDIAVDPTETDPGQVQNPQHSAWLQGPDSEGTIVLGGYEKFIGCVVMRESHTVEIGEIPVREFECLALRRSISDGLKELIEGDGTYPEADAKDAIDAFFPLEE